MEGFHHRRERHSAGGPAIEIEKPSIKRCKIILTTPPARATLAGIVTIVEGELEAVISVLAEDLKDVS